MYATNSQAIGRHLPGRDSSSLGVGSSSGVTIGRDLICCGRHLPRARATAGVEWSDGGERTRILKTASRSQVTPVSSSIFGLAGNQPAGSFFEGCV
jgi:hypothetical protein